MPATPSLLNPQTSMFLVAIGLEATEENARYVLTESRPFQSRNCPLSGGQVYTLWIQWMVRFAERIIRDNSIGSEEAERDYGIRVWDDPEDPRVPLVVNRSAFYAWLDLGNQQVSPPWGGDRVFEDLWDWLQDPARTPEEYPYPMRTAMTGEYVDYLTAFSIP